MSQAGAPRTALTSPSPSLLRSVLGVPLLVVTSEKQVRAAAGTLQLKVRFVNVRAVPELDAALETLERDRPCAFPCWLVVNLKAAKVLVRTDQVIH